MIRIGLPVLCFATEKGRFMRTLLLTLALMLWSLSALAGPKIEHWTTENGLNVYYVEATDIPMLDLRLTFDAGSARDGDIGGVAKLTNFLLSQGADGKNANEIAEGFENVGASFGSGSLKDMAWLSLRTLTEPEFMTPALENFQRVIARPDFPQQDLDRAIKQTLVALKAEEADPSSIANKAYYKAIYGDHPYGHPSRGTVESLAKITRDTLMAHHKKYYVAKNGLLAIVGNVDKATAEKIANTISAGLRAGEKAAPLPKVTPLKEAKEVRIPFPSKQAHVMMGAPAIERGNPDYYALYLGNHSLGGGGFTSRLVKEVRQKRGYAYSVYSYFLLMKEAGPYQIGMQTRGSQADDAIKVVRETVADFVKNGPTDEEITASKKNITGGFPLRVASNSSIVEYLALIGFYDLPLDYLDTFTGHIERQNKADIVAAFQRHVDPNKLVTVVVGGSEE